MLSLSARPDLTAQTHQALRAAIVCGELVPGAPLAQEELAEQLGVSRQPVSHALKLLKAEGLVVDRGRKGQMVAPVYPEKLRALYQVRGALDRLAAQLAASVSLSDVSIEHLNTLVEQCSTGAVQNDIPAMVSADITFHRLLHTLSGNDEIANATESQMPHIERTMYIVLENHPVRSDISQEHRDIADAVIAKDVVKAGELAARHAENAGASTYERLLEIQLNTSD